MAELLENGEPYRFDNLYAGLPDGVRTKMEELSPLAGERWVSVPVESIPGPRDRSFPVSESRVVGGIMPQACVTVSEALDHAELSLSSLVRNLPALLIIDGFVVCALREARL